MSGLGIGGERSCVEGAVLVVHGGAGTILREALTPALDVACRAGLRAALTAGLAVWRAGGDALSIAEAACVVLEDDPLFNAGRGAVFTHDGRNELDAAAMRGHDRAAGAVAGVVSVKNPVRLARAVLETSPHVLLAGAGAEAFADSLGGRIERVGPEWFHTDERWRQLERARRADDVSLSEDNKFGTVGAVARDRGGHLAAATSTGGMTNKRYGRIGDAPIIGAGTWADDATCAVSATGHGEFFLRGVVAHDIACRIEYRGESLHEAAERVIHGRLRERGGQGGVIALDRFGKATLPFNTTGMYRGVATAEGAIDVAIYIE